LVNEPISELSFLTFLFPAMLLVDTTTSAQQVRSSFYFFLSSWNLQCPQQRRWNGRRQNGGFEKTTSHLATQTNSSWVLRLPLIPLFF
jgi:hypothetical protein